MDSPSFLALALAGHSANDLRWKIPSGIGFEVLAEGVIRFEPALQNETTLDLVISCGIHGNETAPVELVDRLISRIVAGELALKSRVLFVLGNLPALRKGVRCIEEDMNRLFCGPVDAQDSPEQRRATLLELCLMRFFARSLSLAGGNPRIHYDLHTSIHGSLIEKFAIYPQPAPGKHFVAAEIARLAQMGIDAVLLQTTEAPTFSFFSSRYCSAAAFTVELGSARPFGQNQTVDLTVLETHLSHLIAHGISPTPPVPAKLPLFQVSRVLMKKSASFRLCLDHKTDNFTPLQQGFCIAEDSDGPVFVDEVDARLVFPDDSVPVGQRAGLIVVPASLSGS